MECSSALIVGNCGSGKSWLSARLARVLEVPAYDLDHFHWLDNSYSQARDEAEAIRLTTLAASRDKWVIEGVYGWLAVHAAPRADILVWLDLPVEECLMNVRNRGAGEGSPENFAALLEWTEKYQKRQSPSSFAGHKKLLDEFSNRKFHLRSREDMASFLADF